MINSGHCSSEIGRKPQMISNLFEEIYNETETLNFREKRPRRIKVYFEAKLRKKRQKEEKIRDGGGRAGSFMTCKILHLTLEKDGVCVGLGCDIG